MLITPIARFHSPFTSKFGIPKQSGLAQSLRGTIVFEKAFRNADALRGIEGFDYLWLIWEFSANRHAATSPVVRPPVLGGNEKVGVFATRSPFRPNPLGLSSVKLDFVDWQSPDAPAIHVSGADLMDGTPIYDIKPYVAYADCHASARSGFAATPAAARLRVEIPSGLASQFSDAQLTALREVLALDPRPHYQDNPDRVYGMPYEGRDVHFKVSDGVLTVVSL